MIYIWISFLFLYKDRIYNSQTTHTKIEYYYLVTLLYGKQLKGSNNKQSDEKDIKGKWLTWHAEMETNKKSAYCITLWCQSNEDKGKCTIYNLKKSWNLFGLSITNVTIAVQCANPTVCPIL